MEHFQYLQKRFKELCGGNLDLEKLRSLMNLGPELRNKRVTADFYYQGRAGDGEDVSLESSYLLQPVNMRGADGD